MKNDVYCGWTHKNTGLMVSVYSASCFTSMLHLELAAKKNKYVQHWAIKDKFIFCSSYGSAYNHKAHAWRKLLYTKVKGIPLSSSLCLPVGSIPPFCLCALWCHSSNSSNKDDASKHWGHHSVNHQVHIMSHRHYPRLHHPTLASASCQINLQRERLQALCMSGWSHRDLQKSQTLQAKDLFRFIICQWKVGSMCFLNTSWSWFKDTDPAKSTLGFCSN